MVKKVLCIDDDNISLTISELLLKRTGFAENVDTAIDGSEALDYFEKIFAGQGETNDAAPELILLDINMPIMNGWDFLQSYVPIYPVVIKFISKPLSVENLEELKTSDYFKQYFA